MQMMEAVGLFFKRYVDFQGRSRRAEYWWSMLFLFIVAAVLTILPMMFAGMGPLGGTLGLVFSIAYLVFSLGTLIPGIAIVVRRLHDLDKSGWWYFIGIVPIIGAILLIYWFCQPGTPGTNRFGPDPKGGVDAEVFS